MLYGVWGVAAKKRAGTAIHEDTPRLKGASCSIGYTISRGPSLETAKVSFFIDKTG